MEAPNLLVKIENSIALFTLNRPQQLNALNHQLINDLNQELEKIKTNKNVKSIIITGSGEKAFVAGADIKEFSKFTREEGKSLAKEGQKKLFDFIENFPKPIIAAINGFALGGGLELAMACHIRLASSNAKMGLPEVSLGVIPGYGGTQRLAQLIGKGKAIEMITTGSMINANQAYNYRLVNNVFEAEELISKCKELCYQIAKNSPNAISAAIKSINAGFDSSLNGFKVEINSFGSCFGTEDFIEGTRAFLEKRKPNF
jgi:enoyl-CoA hydratase